MSLPIPPPSVGFIEQVRSPISTFWYDFLRALAGVSGKWTPTLTFETPGDLAVTYVAGAREGWFTRQGRLVTLHFAVDTATFTHATAANELRVTGIPFLPTTINGSGRFFRGGGLGWQGITKAGYTQIVTQADPGGFISFRASGSGLVVSPVSAADMPTGGSVQLRTSITYETNE